MLSWLFSDPLPVGAAAPAFVLPDETGRKVSVPVPGKNVLLVFYPGDDTTVCTRQLCQLRDNWSRLQEAGVEVFGVNPRSASSHARFREKRELPFPLLVDRGQKAGELYHARGPIVKRTVYLIGADGKIRFGKRGTPAPEEVLAALK